MKRKSIALMLSICIIASLALTGCNQTTEKKTEGTINICYQNGMSYAPFYIMEQKKIIEKYLPNVEVKWSVLGSGSAVSEALVAGTIDVGIMGVGPMLIAWDKGADIKIFSGLVNTPLGLVVMDKKYKNLKNFKTTDKIAVPAPGSIQDVLLQMGAEKALGKSDAFANNIMELAHPDAMTALLNKSGNIVGHFSSPPYIFKEKEQGGTVVVDGFDAFGGDFSFLVTVATKKFMEGSPAYAGALYMALCDAIELINTQDDSTMEIIMEKEKIDKATTIKYLNEAGTNYTTTPYGLTGLAKFMKKAGKITKLPANFSEYCWPTVTALLGERQGTTSVVEKAQERK